MVGLETLGSLADPQKHYCKEYQGCGLHWRTSEMDLGVLCCMRLATRRSTGMALATCDLTEMWPLAGWTWHLCRCHHPHPHSSREISLVHFGIPLSARNEWIIRTIFVEFMDFSFSVSKSHQLCYKHKLLRNKVIGLTNNLMHQIQLVASNISMTLLLIELVLSPMAHSPFFQMLKLCHLADYTDPHKIEFS